MQDNGYKTKQRSAILDCLKENCESSMTVEEISDFMKGEGYTVGKTTVYRYIEKLVQTGEVRKFVAGNGKSATFQFIERHHDCNEHIHLKCVNCGRFIHLDCELMENVNKHIFEHHKFMVDNSKSLLFGLCEKCIGDEKNVTD